MTIDEKIEVKTWIYRQRLRSTYENWRENPPASITVSSDMHKLLVDYMSDLGPDIVAQGNVLTICNVPIVVG